MSQERIDRGKKLHINLSHDAVMIMQHDMDSFQVKQKSVFINRILCNVKYNPEWDAEDLMKESYGKEEQFKIHLNKENAIDYSGIYVKAVLEKYCRENFVKRETIYAKDLFEQISAAITGEKWIKLVFVSGRTVKIMPYTIKTDLLSMYHYVIGYEKVPDADGKMVKKSFSCRISSLDRAVCCKKHAFISQKDKKALDSEMRCKGTQFMCDDVMRHEIYFTDHGIQLYNRMLHLRPAAVDISEDGHTYTFECSQRQIEYYIFKFGADAEVLSPESTRKIFQQKYRDAVSGYDAE